MSNFSTESRLGAISQASPEDAEWIRSLCERLNPRGQRDAAIMAAAALLPRTAVSAKAKALEEHIRRYLSSAWPREAALPSLPPVASPLRLELHRIARLTDGQGLSWRQILRFSAANF